MKNRFMEELEAEVMAAATPRVYPRPWIDIAPTKSETEKLLLVGPGHWLTRGSGVLIVGPTGCGKSTLDAGLAFSFGAGRSFLGFEPVRPLKSVVVQAEDDDLDLAEMARGIIAAIDPDKRELDLIRQNVLVVSERARTGDSFLELVDELLETHRADLVHLNPLSAYFGDDLNDQRAVARFFRNGLNPILTRHGAGFTGIHHTPQPNKDRDAWRDGALAYAGAGSADLANWAREVLTLRQTAPGLYVLTATKRWRKLGWRDADGKPTGTRLVAHARDGSQVWRDAAGDVLAELGATPYTAAALCALVPEAGIDKAELARAVVEAFRLSERTAKSYVTDACRIRRHTVNGETFKCALFTARERPRREVYPDQPATRRCRSERASRGDGSGRYPLSVRRLRKSSAPCNSLQQRKCVFVRFCDRFTKPA
jgi:hypothetical protein